MTYLEGPKGMLMRVDKYCTMSVLSNFISCFRYGYAYLSFAICLITY